MNNILFHFSSISIPAKSDKYKNKQLLLRSPSVRSKISPREGINANTGVFHRWDFLKQPLFPKGQWLTLEMCRLKYIPRVFWVLPTFPGSYVEIPIYSPTGWGPIWFPKHLPWLCVGFPMAGSEMGQGMGELWDPSGNCIPVGLPHSSQAGHRQEGRNICGLCTLELI